MAKTEKSSWAPLRTFLTNVFVGANLATLVLLWVCCASTWIDPSSQPRVAVIGLLFPIFLILNLLFLPLWLIFKPRMLVVPVVGMALCGTYILDYFPLHLKPSGEPADLVVMSWNTHYLDGCSVDSVSAVADFLLDCKVDVACLQETSVNGEKFDKFYAWLRDEGYIVEHEGGQAVVSRFPILGFRTVEIESRMSNAAMCADLLVGEDTLTVFNVHLESISLSRAEKTEYGNVLLTPESEKVKSEARFLTGKLSEAAHYRAMQTQILVDRLDSLPAGRRVLLCGDFNDTPISYTYQTISRRLHNAYRHGGRGVGVSYSENFFPVRIDNVFYSNDWTCLEAHIVNGITVSDHYPLLARLKNLENQPK